MASLSAIFASVGDIAAKLTGLDAKLDKLSALEGGGEAVGVHRVEQGGRGGRDIARIPRAGPLIGGLIIGGMIGSLNNQQNYNQQPQMQQH